MSFWICSVVATDRDGYLQHECNWFVALDHEVQAVGQDILYEVYPEEQGFTDRHIAVRRVSASVLDEALEGGVH